MSLTTTSGADARERVERLGGGRRGRDARRRSLEQPAASMPRVSSLVVDERARETPASASGARLAAAGARRQRSATRRASGQRDGERRALAVAVALGRDAAAVQLDEVLHDRQPEAEAAVLRGCAAVGLAEALEDVRAGTPARCPAACRARRCARSASRWSTRDRRPRRRAA